MTYDFKKEYKALYAPTAKPSIVDVPEMTFIMADGQGNPNTSEEYANVVGALYGIAYTVKMSKYSGETPDGYFDFVVPPLEGLWQIEGNFATLDKDKFKWTSLLRVPDFVTADALEQVKRSVSKKKPELDLSVVRLGKITEGLCGQITHIGPYDDEPATIAALGNFIAESGYQTDISDIRRHHEIYYGDPRKTAPEKLKTVIRHPIKR
jgi:hypothetical protein